MNADEVLRWLIEHRMIATALDCDWTDDDVYIETPCLRTPGCNCCSVKVFPPPEVLAALAERGLVPS